MEDLEEETTVTSIMSIPREVRGIIYSKLNQLQACSIRLVNSQWKSEVDDFYLFSAELDDQQLPPPIIQRICSLRLKRCIISSFLQPPPLGIATTILKHPNLLKNLSIQTDKISPDNFHYLLADAAPFLKEFSTTLTASLISHPFPPTLSYPFNKLTKLSISLNTLLPLGAGFEPLASLQLQDNLFHKLLSNPIPHLTHFRIEVRCIGFKQVSRFSAQILAFISSHGRILEGLDFDLILGHGMPPNEMKPLADSDLEKYLPDGILFKGFKWTIKALRIINSTAVGIDLWAQLLSYQKSLEFLETDILPAPATLFRQVILNNEATLGQIDLGDLTLDLDDDQNELPFDLEIFQNCTSLRKLTLDRNTTRGIGLGLVRQRRQLNLTAQLINLYRLPSSLEELAINYFLIYSDELLILFGSELELAHNLKSITLAQCGGGDFNDADFGVNGTILERIVSLQNINFMEISPLNYSNEEEGRKLNLILTTFGYQEDHSYIQLSRVI